MIKIFFLLLFSLNSMTATEDTEKAISNFVRNIADGNSKIFIRNGTVREGRVISDYKILEVVEEGNLVTAKIQYNIIGSFRANELSPTTSRVQLYPEEKWETDTASYEFVKEGKTYRVKRMAPQRPYVLRSRVL